MRGLSIVALGAALTLGLFTACDSQEDPLPTQPTPEWAHVTAGDGTGCTFDSECPSGACVDGFCVSPCSSDIDCPSDEICSGSYCVDPTPPTPEEQVAARCPCSSDWENHGEYVTCVVRAVDELGLDRNTRGAFISEAARSGCGVP